MRASSYSTASATNPKRTSICLHLPALDLAFSAIIIAALLFSQMSVASSMDNNIFQKVSHIRRRNSGRKLCFLHGGHRLYIYYCCCYCCCFSSCCYYYYLRILLLLLLLLLPLLLLLLPTNTPTPTPTPTITYYHCSYCACQAASERRLHSNQRTSNATRTSIY
jgi:hypothetical protein